MKKLFKNPQFHFILLGLLLCVVPQLAEMGIFKISYVTILGGTFIFAIAALGLNILLGYSGLISLGTAGFMGFAAYLSAYFTKDMNLPFELSFLLAVLIPTLIGILVGLVSLKIEGIYLAIATLAVSEIFRKTFGEFDFFTNGFSGKSASYPTLFGFFELDRAGAYYFVVVVLVIVMLLTYNMMNGRLGRALNAMRGSEAASQEIGRAHV